jgi:transposase
LGIPVNFLVTGGQVNGCTQAIDLLGERKAVWVLADKGYDSQAILDHIDSMGAITVIPSKSNRRQQRIHDKELYRQRNRIERCFCRLKHFRRFATRYEKLNQLQSPRRHRLLLATPSAICRYCLGIVSLSLIPFDAVRLKLNSYLSSSVSVQEQHRYRSGD